MDQGFVNTAVVSQVLLLPSQEESSKNPSVSVAANGNTDLGGATPCLGSGGAFSSLLGDNLHHTT